MDSFIAMKSTGAMECAGSCSPSGGAACIIVLNPGAEFFLLWALAGKPRPLEVRLSGRTMERPRRPRGKEGWGQRSQILSATLPAQ